MTEDAVKKATYILRRLPNFLLHKALRKCYAATEEELKKWNVGVRDIWILLATSESEANQKNVSQLLGINQNVMVNMLDALEKKGLIRREPNPENRREFFLRLQPKGEKLLREWGDEHPDTVGRTLEPLTKKEIDILCELMKKFTGLK